MELWIV